MAEFYIQKHNKFILDTDNSDNINPTNIYKYKTVKTYEYESDTYPVCNICGSDLKFIKRKKYFGIIGCTNEHCQTHTSTHPYIKLQAFLPETIYNNIISSRKKTGRHYTIEYYIEKGYTQEEAENKIKVLKKEASGRNKGKNKQYYINKYGEEYYTNLLKHKNMLCVEYWIDRGFSEESAKQKISQMQSERSNKNKNYRKKPKHIDRDPLFYRERSWQCIEYWIKRGYSEEDGIKFISEKQKELTERRIKKQKENLEEYNTKSNIKNIKYWTSRGYSEDEARNIISESQKTFSLETCIKKYGVEQGTAIFKERQSKWQKSLSANKNMRSGYSKISQDLFDILLQYYENDKKDYIFYATKNKEYAIYNENISRSTLFDFTDLEQKKVIEFQGDTYHANPKKYKAEDHPHAYHHELTAADIWEKDKQKRIAAEQNGFDVFYVWESDYKKDKYNIINQCRKFLNI